MLAILLVTIYLPESPAEMPDGPVPSNDPTAGRKSKFGRIDFRGAILFALTILALLLPLELGGVKLPWSHPIILGLFGLSVVLLLIFVAVERRQSEPILPLEIFHRRDAVFSFLILGFQMSAQLGVRTKPTVLPT